MYVLALQVGFTQAGIQAPGAASSCPGGDSCHLGACQAIGWCVNCYTATGMCLRCLE